MMGYICAEHGFQHDCDTSQSGERICPECGDWVRGVTGRTRGRRAPPQDEPRRQTGNIEWVITTAGAGRPTVVSAFDYITAIDAAVEKVDPQEITEVKPRKREYRGK